MSDMTLPAVIAIGGGVYVLSTQAPLTALPPAIPPQGVGVPPKSLVDSLQLSPTTDPDTEAKITALLQAGEAKFDAMSDTERSAAADYLNTNYNLQPPLSGKESWQQVASIAGGAIGGAYGGPLGAIAGAYLGTTIESWMASGLGDIKTWINQNVPGAVTDWIDNAEKDLQSWFQSIF